MHLALIPEQIFLFADVEGSTCAEDAIAVIAKETYSTRSIASCFGRGLKEWLGENIDEVGFHGVRASRCSDLPARLVARGAPPQDLLAVLASDPARSAGLHPLIVALHQQAGDRIRAPKEVEEVAADLRDRFHKAGQRVRAVP